MAAGDPLRTGKLARGAVTGLALARAGVAHVGHKVRRRASDPQADARHEAELGKILFRALNQLKGTALKASQLLSLEASLLPAGVRQELARSFHQATPLNRALVHKVFRQEFAEDPGVLFAQFDPRAFAAASLGQVHHAVMHGGERVVVKVQYPGIAASIGSDMRMIRTLLQGLRLGTDLLPGHDIVERVMAGIEEKLAEEVDYTHEAAQLQWFGAHASLPDVQVPQPVASRSTRRVLTMQALDGLHLGPWLATGPGPAARNRAGQALFDWFMRSVFDWGRLHADPHPGNFLFTPEGRVGVVDFGCTERLSPAFSQAIARAWCALLQPGPARGGVLREVFVGLGLIPEALSMTEFEQALMPALAPMHAWQTEPFRRARFDFGTRMPYPVPEASRHRVLARCMTGVPAELPYFERAYLGINHLLQQLGAEVDTRNPWIH